MHFVAALPLVLALQNGSLPPAGELTGFTNTEAAALGDFFGQTVLVDFFAQWCAPCARQVPHLNELAERYGARGLHVLGVTADSREVAEAWLERFGAEYPHAYDAALAVQIELGFRPLPFAILLDATGLVVWSGNPAELEDATVESALTHVVPLPLHAWPEGARPIGAALREGRFGSALHAVEALEDARLGKDLERLLRASLESRLRIVEAAWESGDYLTVERLATVLAEDAPPEMAERFLWFAQALAKDGDKQAVLEGQRELSLLWSTVGEIGTSAEADALREEIETFGAAYEGTHVAVQAADRASALKLLAASLP